MAVIIYTCVYDMAKIQFSSQIVYCTFRPKQSAKMQALKKKKKNPTNSD